jgi:hypothetical protein
LLVTGSISLSAQRALTERNWSLVGHLPYPGAPPYAPSPATTALLPRPPAHAAFLPNGG